LKSLVLIFFVSTQAQAERIRDLFFPPKFESLICQTSSEASVYLLRQGAVFNKDKKYFPQYPEVKGTPGEYILENKRVVYFTPGRSEITKKENVYGIAMSFLNDGLITKKDFKEIRPDSKHFIELGYNNALCLAF
jgi:hypothetical protein